jgi:hypothetical protein
VEDEMTRLSHSLVVELAGSIGFRNSRLVQSIMWPIFRPVTDRLAQIGITFDRDTRELGFSKAMGNALQTFVSSVESRGNETFPPEGPLLVLSNHPGTYDSLVIASQLRRDDFNFISGDIPFLRNLPQAYSHFFCISEQHNDRTIAARKAIRHLQAGGAMLVYGYGHSDPDPAVYYDAEAYLDRWVPSIDLFLKVVPQTRILICLVSHVVARKWRESILYNLRKNPIDRRRLVMFGQVMYQLLRPGRLRTAPKISFDQPISLSELKNQSNSSHILPAVIARAKDLYRAHTAWVQSLGQPPS